MHDNAGTFHWIMPFLAFGVTAKSMLLTVSALRHIGDIFAAEGQDESALSVLTASLQGFTAMDIHRDKARCMVRIATLYRRHGEFEKALDLWRKARPLFERSSQASDVAMVDNLIQSATKNVEFSAAEDSYVVQG
jgi:hypothetical protein